jgi:lipoprotein-anchoring transpeptidase ErfK/SrfK
MCRVYPTPAAGLQTPSPPSPHKPPRRRAPGRENSPITVALRPPVLFLLFGLLVASRGGPAQAAPESAAPAVEFQPVAPRTYPRPVESWLEAQIALARHGFSCGPIDGVAGVQSAAALRAFQASQNLPPTGRLDDDTRAALLLDTPPLTQLVLPADDLADLQPLGKTWLEKSRQPTLAHENALELAAELTHSSHRFIEALNPSVNWNAVTPGTVLSVPDVTPAPFPAKAARLEIRLADHVLQARDPDGRLLAHFPVSIARDAEKRPVGELHVISVIADPNYTFNPETFPESAEARTLGRKLILAPGPNNPVGVAWIGLDRTGYGIHGTPTPEQVGRTESHGCFRLANWDARTLLSLAWVGLPVNVLP